METLIEEKIEIAPELLEQINTHEEKQVIVHCSLTGHSYLESTVRVWPTTYLIPKGAAKKCKILHHFNIVMYPKYQILKVNDTLHFTLIFEGLPTDCKSFDLVEIISEAGAFEARNIQRNKQDVYKLYL